MNGVIDAIGWALADFVWQGIVIGCLTAVVLVEARQASARQRYGIACAGLVACLAWPLFNIATALAAGSGAHPAALAAALRPGPADAVPDSVSLFIAAHLRTLVALWLAGACALALRMVLGLAWIARAQGRLGLDSPALAARVDTLAARIGLRLPVRLRLLPGLASPITAGWLRPVVLVPAALVTGMPPQLLDALLAHELAHIARRDYLVNLLQNIIETVLFYHPAVWWISRQIRVEREFIADDLAARTLGAPRDLALALAELERLQFTPPALALGAHGGLLVNRIARLMRPRTASVWALALPLASLLFLAAGLLGLPQPSTAKAVAGASQPALIDFHSCTKPDYPAAALAHNDSGTVFLAFTVDADGMVRNSRVARSSGHTLLDETARAALARCHFIAARVAGVPVASETRVQYVWTLD